MFNRDGRPVDRDVLRRMNEAIAHRGPDGSGYWVDGPVGLAHQMMRTTPEALHETQPSVGVRGNFVLVYEGLVDNADEIRRAATRASLAVADRTDATAILLAYELWREASVEHLSGDFAFAIWDRDARQCFCGRDQMGIRPFYYHLDDKVFLCGSELRQLLKHPAVSNDPNEGMVGEYLASAITSTEESLYRDIQRLPSAHAMRVSAAGHGMRRYWTFDPGRRIRFRTDGEYAEALLAELRTAVRACARTTGPLGFELSGGLDSSSVLAVARDLAARGEISAPLETFNVSYPGLGCDEGEFVDELDHWWGTKTHRVPFGLQSRREFADALRAHGDFPDYPNGASHFPLYRAATDREHRVLLCGVGGDECLTGHYVHYADMLKQLRMPALLEQLRSDGFPRSLIWSYGMGPLFPQALRRFVRRVRGRKAYPEWITDGFARTVNLADRLRRQHVPGRWQSHAQEEMFRDLTAGWAFHVNESRSRALAERGLEQRSPFCRLNVVRFGLSVPENQRWRQADTKFVLRQAMRGHLPEKIRARNTKTDFAQMFPRALSNLGAAFRLSTERVAALGWIGMTWIDRMHQELAAWQPGSPTASLPIWPLWMTFGIDSWLSRVQSTQR
jgi:asparagine synthase (glutamine-hydrolysing)